MTVLQLLVQSLDGTKTPDPAALTLDQQGVVMASLNAALQAYYEAAPDIYKRTTGWQPVGAPREVVGLSIAAQSTLNTGTPFAAADRGKTIRLGNQYNEIAGAAELVRPNDNATTITQGTIYDDTIAFFDVSAERIVGDPRCIAGSETWPLHRIEGNRARAYYGYQSASGFNRLTANFGWQDRIAGDRPAFYSILPVGGSVATGPTDATLLLRLDPLPTRPCTIEITFSQAPPTLTVAAMWDDSLLPVEDHRVHSILIPLFRAELLVTTLWAKPELAQMVVANQQAALNRLMRLPTNFGSSSVRIGTSLGY